MNFNVMIKYIEHRTELFNRRYDHHPKYIKDCIDKLVKEVMNNPYEIGRNHLGNPHELRHEGRISGKTKEYLFRTYSRDIPKTEKQVNNMLNNENYIRGPHRLVYEVYPPNENNEVLVRFTNCYQHMHDKRNYYESGRLKDDIIKLYSDITTNKYLYTPFNLG